MMEPILEIQSISKKFKIGHKTERYLSFRDRISDFLNRKVYEDFWALNDITFSVNQGDSIGIVGGNGAGKSTLLKILSKITPPTSGRIISRGRVASLLEVGTGFHLELTGRENIFLNGSILGMRRNEVYAKFDEIVAFSGVEKFIDTPLKHYSSGMQLRLAFAVAAFLEPEILIIDEVLAVGDVEFQRKCMIKMEDVGKSGRTILFVSHNLQAVANLCNRAVLLKNGNLIKESTSRDIIEMYRSTMTNRDSKYRNNRSIKDIYFSEIRLQDEFGQEKSSYNFHDRIEVFIQINSKIATAQTVISLSLLHSDDSKIFTTEHSYTFNKGIHNFNVKIPGGVISPGQRSLYAAIHIPNVHAYDELRRVCVFSILETGSPYQKYNGDWDCGVVAISGQWDRM